ncbi:unnamed protein product [Phytophthora fragariaefolia]|uniref:Unnamed protein product n=1 Tax=Phytophthora fragariaefolia TaxID=1490495 RepID=A0A9W7CXP7_9STRA|nr:unnamed protein product [Phytophthora fragariaefolia]
MHDRVALQRRIHAEAIKALHDQIGRLESQVVTIQSSASAASPQQAQHTQQIEAGMAQAQAEREASETALRRSQEDNHVLEASQQAPEASTQQLRRQIDTLERRVSDLRDEKDRQGTKLRAQLARVEADRDQLRDQVDRLTAQSAAAANELRRVVADRGRIATELRSSRKCSVIFSHRPGCVILTRLYPPGLRVDSARGANARLEQRANDLQVDRDELQRLESSIAALAADLTTAHAARSAAESDHDRLRRLDVPVSTHQSKDFFGGDTSCSFRMSTPTTQAASTPAASAAGNIVVASSAATGSSLASTSVVTSTVTTPSSPKRTMSLGDYKKTRGNALFARDELEALFDVGSDADMEDGEEEDEGTSSSTRVDPSVGSRRPREDDSDASSSKRSRSGSDRPLADAGPLSSPRSGGDPTSSNTVVSPTGPVRDPWMPTPLRPEEALIIKPSVGFGVKSTLFIFGTEAAAIRLLVNHSNLSRYLIG